MVRRGSTVRVRQRALQKRRTSALSRSGRLALRRTCGGYGAVYGAFASTRPTRFTRSASPAATTTQQEIVHSLVPLHFGTFTTSEYYGQISELVDLEMIDRASRKGITD